MPLKVTDLKVKIHADTSEINLPNVQVRENVGRCPHGYTQNEGFAAWCRECVDAERKANAPTADPYLADLTGTDTAYDYDPNTLAGQTQQFHDACVNVFDAYRSAVLHSLRVLRAYAGVVRAFVLRRD